MQLLRQLAVAAGDDLVAQHLLDGLGVPLQDPLGVLVLAGGERPDPVGGPLAGDRGLGEGVPLGCPQRVR
ncbi:hypothetical protein ACFVHB_28485 [Kitasatospora sp. NPDC127111]|uniref:hypothetical protein n=1 Tax=Kitasatospora sp. NPDC127111 TaxID=3345363 RepID=UPI00362DEF7D